MFDIINTIRMVRTPNIFIHGSESCLFSQGITVVHPSFWCLIVQVSNCPVSNCPFTTHTPLSWGDDTEQGCRKLLKLGGGGGQMGRLSLGGGSWVGKWGAKLGLKVGSFKQN